LPTPLTAEKQRKLPTTPISFKHHHMLSHVEGEQLELAADMSKFAGADADADACEDKQPDGRG
jgi:hypothetical protein